MCPIRSAEHHVKRNHGVNALGPQQFDALLARVLALRQCRHDQNFRRRAVRAERAGCLLKHLRFDEPENLRRMRQHRRTERLGVPALHHHDGPLDEFQVRRRQNERHPGLALLRVRIQHEEINVVLLALRLRDIFPVLPHQELVQLEVFPDDGFADSRHGILS